MLVNFPCQVRSKAQNVLFSALGTYNFCCRDLIPHVLKFLDPDNSSVTQQQFKVGPNSQSDNVLVVFFFPRAEIKAVLTVLCACPGCLILPSGQPQRCVSGQPARLGVHRPDVARYRALGPQFGHVAGKAVHRAPLWRPRRQNPPAVRDHRYRLLGRDAAAWEPFAHNVMLVFIGALPLLETQVQLKHISVNCWKLSKLCIIYWGEFSKF